MTSSEKDHTLCKPPSDSDDRPLPPEFFDFYITEEELLARWKVPKSAALRGRRGDTDWPPYRRRGRLVRYLFSTVLAFEAGETFHNIAEERCRDDLRS